MATAPAPALPTADVPKDKEDPTNIDDSSIALADAPPEEIPQEDNNEEASAELPVEDNTLVTEATYFNNIKPSLKRKMLRWLANARKKLYYLRFVRCIQFFLLILF